jgi:hypothetical protein
VFEKAKKKITFFVCRKQSSEKMQQADVRNFRVALISGMIIGFLFGRLFRTQCLGYGELNVFFRVPLQMLREAPYDSYNGCTISVEAALVRSFIATGCEVFTSLRPVLPDSILSLSEKDGFTINWFYEMFFMLGIAAWCTASVVTFQLVKVFLL